MVARQAFSSCEGLITIDNFTVLSNHRQLSNHYNRTTAETLTIKKLKPSFNAQKKSVPLKTFYIAIKCFYCNCIYGWIYTEQDTVNDRITPPLPQNPF